MPTQWCAAVRSGCHVCLKIAQTAQKPPQVCIEDQRPAAEFLCTKLALGDSVVQRGSRTSGRPHGSGNGVRELCRRLAASADYVVSSDRRRIVHWTAPTLNRPPSAISVRLPLFVFCRYLTGFNSVKFRHNTFTCLSTGRARAPGPIGGNQFLIRHDAYCVCRLASHADIFFHGGND